MLTMKLVGERFVLVRSRFCGLVDLTTFATYLWAVIEIGTVVSFPSTTGKTEVLPFVVEPLSIGRWCNSQARRSTNSGRPYNADSPEFDSCDDADDRPYQSRSSSWSKRFRRLIPYETARTSVMELGLRSKEEWDEYVADGKVFHGAYLPNHPDRMYASEWVSWEEFLGLMRPYEDAQNLVQQVLKRHTMDEYKRFVSMDKKRAEGLRIPAKPDIVYKNKGWISEEHFFGTFN